MYICPICEKKYDNEEAVVKCYMKCWRESHPCHTAKPAPKSEDIMTREINDDIAAFFSGGIICKK